jgi:hypothetical protein
MYLSVLTGQQAHFLRDLKKPVGGILSGEFHEGEPICVELGKDRLEFTALTSDPLVVQ